MCIESCRLVLDALNHHHRTKLPGVGRFRALVCLFEPEATNTIDNVILLSIRVSALSLMNTILSNTDDLDTRCKIRHEMIRLELEPHLYV
jgi:hypothetical protein